MFRLTNRTDESSRLPVQNRERNDSDMQKGGVAFVFDRVMHYHRATLLEIERRLAIEGIPFHLLSAKDEAGAVGRVAEAGAVVTSHQRYPLWEKLISGYHLRVQRGLQRMLGSLDPDVVVSMCHAGTLSEWQMLHWAQRKGARRVAWQCGYDYQSGSLVKRTALWRFVPLFNFHLCYHSNARRFAMEYGAAEMQTLVMHNTIDERKIIAGDPVKARADLVLKFPQLAGKKLVLYVGAVLAEKKLELVFDALAHLQRQDVVFVLVGDGPHLALLKQRYATRTDWLAAGRVVDGVGLYFDAADVFVLPGTGGLAINEAMAHRVPVISGYADGSADDLVVDGVTGFRLAHESADLLAARLKDILDDPARARAMGLAGEQRIRGHLSFESFIDRVMGVLLDQHAQAVAKRRA